MHCVIDVLPQLSLLACGEEHRTLPMMSFQVSRVSSIAGQKLLLHLALNSSI